MATTGLNPAVDFYFEKAKSWEAAVKQLRKIVLECGLREELKWGVPCYRYPGPTKGNIVLIHDFKEYCALLFFKGALMSNTHHLLIQQTKNVQAARQIRFTSVQEIKKLAPLLKAHIYEAIEIEKAGLKVELKKTTEFSVPEEFQQKLDKNAHLKKAFLALTPGRQRAYLLHFSAPKQSTTREARIEKLTSQILAGKGLNDL
ncbi:MAG: YdeI/OmpD-associated family protein [Ferruginibacter sp.]|nr:YdeI/OmpD-associated family protein [Ferruginibacter sp.]